MDHYLKKTFLRRHSLKSFLWKAYKTFTNCRWMFELFLCRRTQHRSLKLCVSKPEVTFLRAVKPWLHADNVIHAIVNGPNDFDWLQILVDVGAQDDTRTKKLTTSVTHIKTVNSLAIQIAKCHSLKAVELRIMYSGITQNAEHITNLLALRELRKLSILGEYISSIFDNVDTKNLSTLRIFRISMCIKDNISEDRVNFFKGLRNLTTIGIVYHNINVFAKDSYLFGDLNYASICFSKKFSLDQAITRMPALKNLTLDRTKFEWQSVATACPRIQTLYLIDCELTGACDDNSHALCLTTLHLEDVLWYFRGLHKSSFIGQMTASVLQVLRIRYITEKEWIDVIPRQPDNDLVGELGKLREDPRLLTNCRTSIVKDQMICTMFKTARHDRIRVFLSGHE